MSSEQGVCLFLLIVSLILTHMFWDQIYYHFHKIFLNDNRQKNKTATTKTTPYVPPQIFQKPAPPPPPPPPAPIYYTITENTVGSVKFYILVKVQDGKIIDKFKNRYKTRNTINYWGGFSSDGCSGNVKLFEKISDAEKELTHYLSRLELDYNLYKENLLKT